MARQAAKRNGAYAVSSRSFQEETFGFATNSRTFSRSTRLSLVEKLSTSSMLSHIYPRFFVIMCRGNGTRRCLCKIAEAFGRLAGRTRSVRGGDPVYSKNLSLKPKPRTGLVGTCACLSPTENGEGFLVYTGVGVADKANAHSPIFQRVLRKSPERAEGPRAS